MILPDSIHAPAFALGASPFARIASIFAKASVFAKASPDTSPDTSPDRAADKSVGRPSSAILFFIRR